MKISSLPAQLDNPTNSQRHKLIRHAGTALATGNKTNNGVIGQLPDGTNVKTLIEEAETKGKATGIVTTTRLTHATPATFASHNVSRGNENEIAVDYLDSGVDFFAGGGYRNFIPKSEEGSKREDDRNLVKEFEVNEVYFMGFLDGINESIDKELDLEAIEAETEVSFKIDYEKLYFNMLDSKADYLYTLPQWDRIFSQEKRREIQKTWRESKTVINEVKIGRNDACPCGSGKKYKKCCGK